MSEEKKKIRHIQMIDAKTGEELNWNADTLGWVDLPQWLLGQVYEDFPNGEITVEYYKRFKELCK